MFQTTIPGYFSHSTDQSKATQPLKMPNLTTYEVEKIFGYLSKSDLDSAALVCHAWREASYVVRRRSTSTRICPKTQEEPGSMSYRVIAEIVAHRGATLKSLTCGPIGCNVRDRIFKSISNCCALLTVLNINVIKGTDKGLAEIGRGCPQLRGLTISGVSANCKLTDKGFSDLFKG